MLPMIQAFMAAHRLTDVTVVADAGMMSEANQEGDRGRRAVVHRRRPDPRRPLPGRRVAQARIPASRSGRRAGLHPAVAGGRRADQRRDQTIFYQYRADRARRTLRGHRRTDRQGREGRRRAGRRSSGTGSSSSPAATKTSTGPGGQGPRPGRVEGLRHQPAEARPPEYVIGAYHQLWQIEKSFRMSKHDLRARPIYHHKRDSIEAHLTIVFAALAVSRLDREPAPAGRSRSSSRPPAATAPSPSRPATTPSPPQTRYPTTSQPPSTPSGNAAAGH